MEFVEIFTQMSWVVALLLAIGAVFMIIELFVPGFGFFGITGILSLIAGVVVRICDGLNVTQSIALCLFVLVFFVIVTMLMVGGAKHGLLGKSGLFERRTSISQDYNEVSKQYRKLVGKSGKAITKIDLAGKAKINGKIYDVMSINSYIEIGQHVKVVEIKNNTIMVRKWFE